MHGFEGLPLLAAARLSSSTYQMLVLSVIVPFLLTDALAIHLFGDVFSILC